MNDSPLNSEKPLLEQDSQSQNLASESLENQGLQEPEIEIGDKCPSLAFEQINEVTWKLTDGRGTNAWDGYRGGYRTSRAVAWLMGLDDGFWVVRYRNKASKPMKLNKAKTYALEMVKGVRPGVIVTDPIADLHCLSLGPEPLIPDLSWTDRVEDDGDWLQGDDCQLEYYPDGYPILPDCLRRNAAEGLADGRASCLSNRKILSGNRTF